MPVPAAYAGVLNVLNVGLTGFAALEPTFPQWIWNYNPFYGDIALWRFPTLQRLPM